MSLPVDFHCKQFIFIVSSSNNDIEFFLLVPCNIVGKSELEANEKDRDFAYFKYGCVGYSVCSDRKGQRDVRDKKSELPACIGIEVVISLICYLCKHE